VIPKAKNASPITPPTIAIGGLSHLWAIRMLTAVASKLRIDKMRNMIALVMILRDPFRLPEPVAEAGYRQAAIAPAKQDKPRL
jgi:hypothetical protein